MKTYDVIIIGAGGAGLMCALTAGKRGRKVVVLDHGEKIGAKILISGGGRCNFTNLGTGPENYVSNNPHFAKSALSRYTAQDFLKLIKEHRVAFHEKKLGQLFCDRSAQDIVNLLQAECEEAKVHICLQQKITSIEKNGQFEVKTMDGYYAASSLVIATGGLSIPKIGATDLGYRIAKQFGLNIIETHPALDGFRLKEADLKKFGDLTGVAVDSLVTAGETPFRENLLFTHMGLSGPAALQASLYWNRGEPITINFIPKMSYDQLWRWFVDCKKKGSKSEIKTLLAQQIPSRLADRLCALELPEKAAIHQTQDKKLQDFSRKIQNYVIHPENTVGYSKAEVTRGGIDTNELSSRTMEAKKVPGLYFIGEVIDVTGWLGGYNFQWAWASGHAAGEAV